ncbi:MAG: hypothetical protein WBB18_05735, partial [Nodosilinea sp.]
PALVSILAQLIQQRPKDRFQTAAEVAQRLTPLAAAVSPSSPLIIEPNWAQDVSRSDSPTAADPSIATSDLRDPSFIATCRQELARCIGPMAGVVVEEMLDQYPQATPGEFVDILASQLSNGRQATDFVSRLQVVVDDSSGSLESALSSSFDPKFDQLPEALPSTAARPNPEFLNRCRQTLARCIGPMANYLVDDILADFPHLSPQDLVTRLAAEIPDPNKADDFRRQMQ